MFQEKVEFLPLLSRLLPHNPQRPLLQVVVFSLGSGCSWKQRCLPPPALQGYQTPTHLDSNFYLTAHSCFFNYMQRQ